MPDRTKSFTLRGIADGEYQLFIHGDQRFADPQAIKVKGGDVTGLRFTLHSLGEISGRIVLDKKLTDDSKDECKEKTTGHVEEVLTYITALGSEYELFPILLANNNLTNNASTSPDGKGVFAYKGLEAAKYRLGTNLPSDRWFVKSITRTDSAGKPIPNQRTLSQTL